MTWSKVVIVMAHAGASGLRTVETYYHFGRRVMDHARWMELRRA